VSFDVNLYFSMYIRRWESTRRNLANAAPTRYVCVLAESLTLLVMLQVKLLQRAHLEAALSAAGIKHVTRDTVDVLCKKIIESWAGARKSGDSMAEQQHSRQAGGDSGDTAVSRQHTDSGHSMQDGDLERADESGNSRQQSPAAADGGASLASTFADDDKTLPDSCEVFTSREASPLAVREAGDGSPAAAGTGEPVEAAGDVSFGSEHLAEVLHAALPTKVAMKELVNALKAKDAAAFREVQLSSRSEGLYSTRQIADKVAGCKPGQVAGAAELLRWLIKVRSCLAFE
jgi:hypothetical protein